MWSWVSKKWEEIERLAPQIDLTATQLWRFSVARWWASYTESTSKPENGETRARKSVQSPRESDARQLFVMKAAYIWKSHSIGSLERRTIHSTVEIQYLCHQWAWQCAPLKHFDQIQKINCILPLLVEEKNCTTLSFFHSGYVKKDLIQVTFQSIHKVHLGKPIFADCQTTDGTGEEKKMAIHLMVGIV